MERLATADRGDTSAAVDAALERARAQIEALAEAAAALEATLPERVGDAVRDGVRTEALPVARGVAEIRGLLNATLRRLEGVENALLTERHARVDDLAVLVELVTSGWKSVDARLARVEQNTKSPSQAVLYRIEERRPLTDGTQQ
jgi:hypothetical protein